MTASGSHRASTRAAGGRARPGSPAPRACTGSGSPTWSAGSRSTSACRTISRSRASPTRSPWCATSCRRWRGTSARTRAPAKVRPWATAAPRLTPTRTPTRSAMHSVLVVDDEPFVRLSLVALYPFGLEGFDFAAEAADGAEALAVLAARPEIDIVLLDLSMPVMDGLEVLRRLRADPLPRP